jgi:hypothetical protein
MLCSSIVRVALWGVAAACQTNGADHAMSPPGGGRGSRLKLERVPTVRAAYQDSHRGYPDGSRPFRPIALAFGQQSRSPLLRLDVARVDDRTRPIELSRGTQLGQQ